jgi:hypothetical protein
LLHAVKTELSFQSSFSELEEYFLEFTQEQKISLKLTETCPDTNTAAPSSIFEHLFFENNPRIDNQFEVFVFFTNSLASLLHVSLF